MQVNGIDHVNILTHDLDGTVTFYERLLGLTRSETPGATGRFRGAWMRDENEQAIVHLVWKDPASDRYAGYEPGQPTHAVHHVAFSCQGFDAARERLDAMGIPYRVSDQRAGGVRQIVLADPNAVNLELNFAGD